MWRCRTARSFPATVCVHQFCRVGTLALMQGGSAISQDLPPFTVAQRDNEICGLNVIGLRRAGFTAEQRLELKRLYRHCSAAGKICGRQLRKRKKHLPAPRQKYCWILSPKQNAAYARTLAARPVEMKTSRKARMYKILGADGREYGPATAGQLRQWMAEGRANAQTPTLAPGAPEWKPLGALPEFAAHFAPPIPPAIGPLKPGASTAGQLPKTNSFATAGLIFGILSADVLLLLLLRLSVQHPRTGLLAHRTVANQPASRTLRRPRPGHCRTDSFGSKPGFGIRSGLVQSCAPSGEP